jgi:uncharacterized membrane protein YqhA
MLRKLLLHSRFILVLAVIGSLFLTLSVMVTALLLIGNRIWQLIRIGDLTNTSAKTLTTAVIQALDMFLVGALSYIIAVGIYKLFISTEDDTILRRIRIEDFVDLKKKIISVVVVALAVAFLGMVVEAVSWRTVLGTGAGMALVVSALAIFYRSCLLQEH